MQIQSQDIEHQPHAREGFDDRRAPARRAPRMAWRSASERPAEQFRDAPRQHDGVRVEEMIPPASR